jgi:hypothetical protein
MLIITRVFISCGQRKNADYLTITTKENAHLMALELEVAKQISQPRIRIIWVASAFIISLVVNVV